MYTQMALFCASQALWPSISPAADAVDAAGDETINIFGMTSK